MAADIISNKNDPRRHLFMILALVSIAAIIMIALPGEVSDDSDAAVGETFTKDGINYKITSASAVKVIAGTYSGDVVIPSYVICGADTYDVTAMDSNAFRKNVLITSVSIPGSIQTIANYSFQACESLTSITIGNGVQTIDKYAFYNCTSLTSVAFPSSVETIGERSFYGCSSLTSLVIPDGVQTIGNYAFYNCTSITTVNIGSNVSSVGAGAFLNCKSLAAIYVSDINVHFCSDNGVLFDKGKTLLMIYPMAKTNATYSVPDSVENIGNSAFYGCTYIISVDIGSNTETIGNSAFYGCPSLTSLVIPDNTISIGDSAFYNCSSLTSVAIGSNVETIGVSAFGNCRSVSQFTVSESNSHFLAKEDVLFSKDMTKLYYYPVGKESDNYAIPDSVITIGEFAFANSTFLTSVTIPEGVTAIGNSAFLKCTALGSVTIPSSVTSIGTQAFLRSTALKEFSVSADNANYCSDEGVLFSKDMKTLIQYPASNERTSYTIPDSVTELGDQAFYGCSCLISIVITEGVTGIGANMFYNSTALESVSIPSTVTAIGTQAFYGCTSMKAFSVSSDNDDYCSADGVLFSKDMKTLIQYPASKDIDSYNIPDTVETIGVGAFYGSSYLISVTIPDSVRTIGDRAFYSCVSLTSIAIPEGVSVIGNYTFYKCVSLRSITVPGTITDIGSYAFYNCFSLTSVFIPASVGTIGSDAFLGCNLLVEVRNDSVLLIKEGSKDNGYVAYYAVNVYSSSSGRSILRTQDIDTSSYAVYYEKDGRTSLVSVFGHGQSLILPDTLGGSAYSIHSYAFYARSITSVEIGGNVTSIDEGAFSRCTDLRSMKIGPSDLSASTFSFEKGLTFISVDKDAKGLSKLFENYTFCDSYGKRIDISEVPGNDFKADSEGRMILIKEPSNTEINMGLVIGIVCAVIAEIVLIIIVVLYVRSKRNRHRVQ